MNKSINVVVVVVTVVASFALLGIAHGATAQEPSSPASARIFDIPRIADIAVDGAADDWADQGLHVDALTPSEPQPPDAEDFDAQVRIGWDAAGLLVLVRVHDDRWVETDAPASMFERDSVELLIKPSLSSDQIYQPIFGPGAGGGRDQLRSFLHDYRSNDQLRASPARYQAARTIVPGGYVLEVRIPLEAIGLSAQQGAQCALAVTVNDYDGEGRYVRHGWQKHGWSFLPIRLAATASRSVRAAASPSYERMRRTLVCISADRDLAGRKLDLIRGGDILVSGAIPAAPSGQRLSFVRLTCPMPADGAPWDGLTLRIDGEDELPVRVDDPKGIREEAARQLEVVASACVFRTAALPLVRFAEPSLAEDVLGPCTVQVRYFDARYEPVRYADAPGRYGAIFEARDAAGNLKLERFLTLFRTTDIPESTERRERLGGLLAAEAGIPDRILATQTIVLSDDLGQDALARIGRDPSAAQVLAAVSESAANAGPVNPRAADQRWWHGLRKRLGMVQPLRYVEFLPAGYDPAGAKKWPLIIFLHGSGGFDLDRLQHDGVKRIADLAPQRFAFIVVQPSCPDFRPWSPPQLDDLLDDLLRTHAIDPDRVYLTGFSMGGFGTWDWALDSPQRFAAIAPSAGGADPRYASRAARLPVWIFHSQSDETVGISLARDMADALTKSGGTVKTTFFDQVNHTTSLTRTYDTEELYTWFLQHRRAPAGVQ